MGNTMLFTALREFTTGLLNQLLVNLSGQDGQTWLEEFKKFLRRETCWIETLESFFLKTVQIVLEPTEEEFNVVRDISKILPTKKEGGKVDWRDPDIEKWFGEITVKGRASKVVSSLYRFLKTLTHGKIISIGEKFKIYKKHNIFDALELTQKLIDTGEIEKKGTGVIIYLEEKYNNSLCRLGVYRNSGGRLRVGVHGVSLGLEWDAESGVLFS